MNSKVIGFAVVLIASHNLMAQLPPDTIKITTSIDVEQRREALIDYIWGTDGMPKGEPDTIEYNSTWYGDIYQYNPLYTDEGNLSRIDRYTIRMDNNFTSEVFHFHPRYGNNKLFIYHAGHGSGFINEDIYVNNSAIRPGLVIPELIKRGYSVLAFNMPLNGNTIPVVDLPEIGQVTMSNHDIMFQFLDRPYRYFFDPIAVCLNYIELHFEYTEINMMGLSGGGWTTTLYSALDTRILKSYPIAGSVPLYLRPGYEGLGDAEQGYDYSGLYGIANYHELYVMGSSGTGREQTQILNRYDNCCFYGVRHPAWVAKVRETLSILGESDNYRFYLDETNMVHSVSPYALDIILNDRKEDIIQAPILFMPAIGSTGQTLNPFLDWTQPKNTKTYQVQMSTDSSFNTIVRYINDIEGWNSTFCVENLSPASKYFWRVRASDGNNYSDWSGASDFSTIPNSPFIHFTTAIDTNAWEDSIYQFLINVSHDNYYQSLLHYSLIIAPNWLDLDTTRMLIAGIPSRADVGDTLVVLQVRDPDGEVAELRYNLRVHHVNHAPVFMSGPDTIALEDEVYNYTAYAYDQDSLLFNDKIKYRLVIGPHWLTMDSISGVLQGIPDGYSVGDTTVLLEATDGFVTIQQSFELKIVHVNHAPIFLSSTDSVAKVDSLYRFQLYAFDKDSFLFNDILRYRLFDGPDWMTIDSVSGVIIGVPNESDIGKHLVMAEAYDRNDSSSEVEWAVTVGRAFRPPTAVALENPTHQDTLTLFKIPLMRTFTWSKANDPDSQDTLLYHFRIYGPGLDTVFHGIKDTNVTFSGILFQENSKYYWTVKVFDGMFTVSSIDTFYFHTTKRFSNQTFEELPKSFELFQNYPNPFNPNTILRFQVPEESDVILNIYNMLGQTIQRIYKERLSAKYYEIDWKAEGKASGIYIIRMEAIGKISGRRYIKSRRILLLK